MITVPAELRRDRSRPVTDIHMDYCSHQAKIIVDRIRDYLPVEGQEKDVEWHVQSNAYGDITACYGNIETVRNPGQSEFHPQRSSSYHVECYTSAKTPWVALCASLDQLCMHYGWQKFSKPPGGVPFSFPPLLPEGVNKLPRVPGSLLDQINDAACQLINFYQRIREDNDEGVTSLTESVARVEELLTSSSTDSVLIAPWARRAKDAEAKLALIDKQKDLLISLGGTLSSLDFAIVSYLWHRGAAPAAEIGRHCWPSEPSPDTRNKAIKRTKDKLSELDCGVFIDGSKNDIVTLIKPDK